MLRPMPIWSRFPTVNRYTLQWRVTEIIWWTDWHLGGYSGNKQLVTIIVFLFAFFRSALSWLEPCWGIHFQKSSVAWWVYLHILNYIHTKTLWCNRFSLRVEEHYMRFFSTRAVWWIGGFTSLRWRITVQRYVPDVFFFCSFSLTCVM